MSGQNCNGQSGERLLQIMKVHGIWADEVAWVVGKIVSAVVNYGLESPYRSKQGSLAIVEASDR